MQKKLNIKDFNGCHIFSIFQRPEDRQKYVCFLGYFYFGQDGTWHDIRWTSLPVPLDELCLAVYECGLGNFLYRVECDAVREECVAYLSDYAANEALNNYFINEKLSSHGVLFSAPMPIWLANINDSTPCGNYIAKPKEDG